MAKKIKSCNLDTRTKGKPTKPVNMRTCENTAKGNV
nr:MAG TPA: hypothetical protein [Inoviridae sp.]